MRWLYSGPSPGTGMHRLAIAYSRSWALMSSRTAPAVLALSSKAVSAGPTFSRK